MLTTTANRTLERERPHRNLGTTALSRESDCSSVGKRCGHPLPRVRRSGAHTRDNLQRQTLSHTPTNPRLQLSPDGWFARFHLGVLQGAVVSLKVRTAIRRTFRRRQAKTEWTPMSNGRRERDELAENHPPSNRNNSEELRVAVLYGEPKLIIGWRAGG